MQLDIKAQIIVFGKVADFKLLQSHKIHRGGIRNNVAVSYIHQTDDLSTLRKRSLNSVNICIVDM